MVRAEHHGLVDILDGGDAGLNEADGLVDHGDEDLVDDEAGSSTGCLPISSESL